MWVFSCALAWSLWTAPLWADFSGHVRVIDGDTFDVGTVRVRLFGIDAPEADQSCENDRGVQWDCGAWVTSRVTEMYEEREVHCTEVDRDRYGRTVARCSADDGDIGRRLVEEGMAFAYRRYSLEYDLDEKGAVIRGAGIHAGHVDPPWEYRRARAENPGVTPATTSAGCAIKGNISRKGARIFHVPGQKDYARTRIDTARGERWFCSAEEARTAGWRAARR